MYLVEANATFSAGASNLSIFLVDGHGAGATELLLWSEVGAATTVLHTLSFADLPAIRVQRGQRILIRYTGGTASTVGLIQVHGLAWQE
jgi:hypothetical protein